MKRFSSEWCLLSTFLIIVKNAVMSEAVLKRYLRGAKYFLSLAEKFAAKAAGLLPILDSRSVRNFWICSAEP